MIVRIWSSARKEGVPSASFHPFRTVIGGYEGRLTRLEVRDGLRKAAAGKYWGRVPNATVGILELMKVPQETPSSGVTFVACGADTRDIQPKV